MKRLRIYTIIFTTMLLTTLSFNSIHISAATIKNHKPVDHIIDITYQYPFYSIVHALQDDGTILHWRELDDWTPGIPEIQKGPTISGAIQITGNYLVLKNDGTVWEWDRETNEVSQITELHNIIEIQSNQNMDIALDQNGVTWTRGEETKIAMFIAGNLNYQSPTDDGIRTTTFQRAQEGVTTFYLFKESFLGNDILIAKNDGTWEHYYHRDFSGKEEKIIKGNLPEKVKVKQILRKENPEELEEANTTILVLSTDGRLWQSLQNGTWKEFAQGHKQYTQINQTRNNYSNSINLLSVDTNGNVIQADVLNENFDNFKQLSNIKKVLARENGEGIALDQEGYVWKWKAKSTQSIHTNNTFITNVVPTLVVKSITVNWNGQPLSLAYPPVMQKSLMVPMRDLFEAFGAKVQYNQGRITATQGNNKIQLTVYSKNAVVNGKNVTLTDAPTYIDGKTYVPLRFIAQSLGASVAWDPIQSSVEINYSK